MSDFVLPETRYALSGDVNIAYQVMGDGPMDIIMVPGFVSHVEFMHELAGYTAFLRRLSTFAHVVTFDKRGQRLPDRISGAPTLEQRMDDVRAVMDGIGSLRAVIVGFSEGCAMSVLFAATYPERVVQLVLFGGFALGANFLATGLEARIARTVKVWGTGEIVKAVIPSQAANQNAVSNSPNSNGSRPVRAGSERSRRSTLKSISDRLPTVQVPTLVLQSSEVLVSRVVTDLVAGAGLKFSERGSFELKGLPGRWDLFAATA
jgi:pimeloyl-ACP methyl ester carboxylesterase